MPGTHGASNSAIPKHLGIILDGNRRWAEQQGMPAAEGHLQGYKNIRTITNAAFEHGVQYISLYLFSTENWKRTPKEVKLLMQLGYQKLVEDVQEIHEHNIRILWLGSDENVSPKLIRALHKAEEITKQNSGGVLALCFNHSGQQEITAAVRRIVADGVPAAGITETTIAQYLNHSELPPLDLIIRTSGEERLSNFMLWRAAYSELYFVQKHWPAFTPADLHTALQDYAARKRRFGT
jgi:undecaprenyl diphosphate synthase